MIAAARKLANPSYASSFLVYVNVTGLYGLIRAVTYDYSWEKNYFNSKTGNFETKDMLLTDKVGRIAHNAISAVFLWPITLREDLARLECAARGKDTKEFQNLPHF
jgi:hypothetical protein